MKKTEKVKWVDTTSEEVRVKGTVAYIPKRYELTSGVLHVSLDVSVGGSESVPMYEWFVTCAALRIECRHLGGISSSAIAKRYALAEVRKEIKALVESAKGFP
jgi:hypothetical protein